MIKFKNPFTMNFELGGAHSPECRAKRKIKIFQKFSSKLFQRATYKENLATQWTSVCPSSMHTTNFVLILGLLSSDKSPRMQQTDVSLRDAKTDGLELQGH